jgi:hypothetical protein
MKEDAEIVSWAEVVEDLLYHVSPEKRAAVLEFAVPATIRNSCHD